MQTDWKLSGSENNLAGMDQDASVVLRLDARTTLWTPWTTCGAQVLLVGNGDRSDRDTESDSDRVRQPERVEAAESKLAQAHPGIDDAGAVNPGYPY